MEYMDACDIYGLYLCTNFKPAVQISIVYDVILVSTVDNKAIMKM